MLVTTMSVTCSQTCLLIINAYICLMLVTGHVYKVYDIQIYVQQTLNINCNILILDLRLLRSMVLLLSSKELLLASLLQFGLISVDATRPHISKNTSYYYHNTILLLLLLLVLVTSK
jgi:uncharacterized protein (UPF0179 family)